MIDCDFFVEGRGGGVLLVPRARGRLPYRVFWASLWDRVAAATWSSGRQRPSPEGTSAEGGVWFIWEAWFAAEASGCNTLANKLGEQARST